MSARTENLLARGPMLAPDGVSGGSGDKSSLRSQEGEWWHQHQAVFIVDSPQVLGSVDASTQAKMSLVQQSVFQQFSDVYSGSNNRVIRIGSEKKLKSGEQFSHGVILNPIFLEIPPVVTQALREINEFEPDRHNNEDPRTRALKQTIKDEMPQVRWPLIDRVGEPICKDFGLEPTKHQNFTNVVFFDDTDGAFQQLPYDWNQWLHWSFMAKTGSFKVITVPLSFANGQVDHDLLTLYTLEGAAPKLPSEVVAERLQVFGSADKVGDDWKEIEGIRIPYAEWEQSDMVQGMQALGRFAEAATPRLLSEPVGIGDFAHGALARVISGMARFSSQAEGAMMQWGNFDGLPQLAPWDGVTAVTKSGKFGALKTDLKPEDIMAIYPSGRKSSEVDVVAIKGIETKGPSVEAGEFTGPLQELAQQDPSRYLTRLQRVSGGWVVDRNGETFAPVIPAIFHKHRGANVNGDGRVLFYDPQEPPVPCGTNLTYNITRKAIIDVMEMVALEHQRDNSPVATEVVVENHGTTTLVHWPKEGGFIPDDLFAPYKEAVTSGGVRYSMAVPQK